MLKSNIWVKVALFLGVASPFGCQAIDLSDRIQASVKASAIGDAMGNPTEFIKTVDAIFKQYPQGIRHVIDLKPKNFILGLMLGLPDKNAAMVPYTDDTAMALITLDVLCSYQPLLQAATIQPIVMADIASCYVHHSRMPWSWDAGFRAPGNACMAAARELEKRMRNAQAPFWYRAGDANAGGCGSVMRAYPFGIAFWNDPQKAASWAAEHSLITHGAPLAQAACAAMAIGEAYVLQGVQPDVVVRHMIAAAKQYDATTANMIEHAYQWALKNKAKAKNVGELFELSKPVFAKYLGWAAHDAIAATVYIFTVCPDNLADALYLGVHTPGDSDSLAAMAGALVGARVGTSQLPKDWLAVLEPTDRYWERGKKESCDLATESARVFGN